MPDLVEFLNTRFLVREDENGHPYIATREKGAESNKIFNDKTEFLLFLERGTSLDEAQKLVAHLNRLVIAISVIQSS